MLLRFSVKNYRSIRDEQELLFTASSLKDEGVDLLDSGSLGEQSVLPALVVYGANASGKSNLISALSHFGAWAMLSHVASSHINVLPHSPFLLDKASQTEPTAFEMDFEIEGVRYQYGFEYTEQVFEREWLYSYPHKVQRLLFEREGQSFKFGRELKGRNKVISEFTRPNSTFLSTAFQNNHEQVTAICEIIFSWDFANELSISSERAIETLALESGGRVPDEIIEFLGQIGTGVVDSHMVKMRTVDAENPQKNQELVLGYKTAEGSIAYLPADMASAGTLRLLSAMPKVFYALKNGSLAVIDELDMSLHTKAAEAVLALFASKETNPHGAQLLATTHDTNLLSSKKLRRDQVWLAEKQSHGATEIYPLTEFKTHKNDNLEKGYLQGRYGAIPDVEW